MSGIKYNRRVVEILLLCLVAITMINVAIVLAKHAEDGIKQKQIKSEELFDKVDSSYSKSDTVTLNATVQIERGAKANEHLLELIGKYELALEQLRTHDFEAYKYFVKSAQFKENYNELVDYEFHGENKYIKEKANSYR
jgi:hypothetical protein